MATTSAQWDFPRLDEIIFKIKYPYTVSLEAAKACEIDTYVGAIRTVEVDTLRDPPYGWSVTAAPGFHMCAGQINCRDVTPDTSGGRLDYHGRTPGFELYPLNITAFRYALELLVGCNKTVWINDIYGYINVRLDTNIPPANVKWYNPSIVPYPLDWDEAYNQLIAAGFSGTVGGDDWLMPNGQPLREPIYTMAPIEAPTTVELARRHCKSWNSFFCGYEGLPEPPHDYNFVLDIVLFYDEIDTMFYNRDHDIGMLCWGLTRNPDYLWDFFHPDADIPDAANSPGLDYRPLNAMIDALKWCMWTEKTELRMYGPGPVTVSESTKYYTDYAFDAGSEDVWIGQVHGSGGYPYRAAELEVGVDYAYIESGGKMVGIHFLNDLALGPDMYVHMVYTLETPTPINIEADLIQVCYDIQDMLYYMCPYLPCYSRNYHDLYKAGVESWVPSLGYGSAAYQLKWTYGSIHWTGAPVGGTINWMLGGPVNSLHPWLFTSVYEATIMNRLYDAMLSVDAYTHRDIPMCAVKYKIEDWTGPSGEPGMIITWWIRNDLTWQDGDPITVDDLIFDYEFINSIRPNQLYSVWAYYHGCTKLNDYCFSIKVNTTGVWAFYLYTAGPTYPRKVWLPFFGNQAAAEAYRPWLEPHPNGTLPTALYGTGEWIYDYFDTVLGIIRVYKKMRTRTGTFRCVLSSIRLRTGLVQAESQV
jgi:ABC-type transport system substrate-binding protein